MTKLSAIRAWKERWGYDDMAVMPGGRPMKRFAPDRKLLDTYAEALEFDAAAITRRLENSEVTDSAADEPPPEHTEQGRLMLAAQADSLRGRAATLRVKSQNPAALRLDKLASSLIPGSEGVEGALTELAKALRLEADRIRLTDELPDRALVAKVATAIRDTRSEEASSLDDWAEDLQHPYDPAQGPLATSIAERIRDRSILDRTAAVDQVTHNIYSADRSKELMALTGNSYLAQAFGMRAIKEETRNSERSGILFDNNFSSLYQRDRIGTGVKDAMTDLYITKFGAKARV